MSGEVEAEQVVRAYDRRYALAYGRATLLTGVVWLGVAVGGFVAFGLAVTPFFLLVGTLLFGLFVLKSWLGWRARGLRVALEGELRAANWSVPQALAWAKAQQPALVFFVSLVQGPGSRRERR